MNAARALGWERGTSLVELCVVMVLMGAVLTATLNGFDSFQKNTHVNEQQNESQARARVAMANITHDLRSVASRAGGEDALEKATSQDVVFQSFDGTGTLANGLRRVRYCLDASATANGKLWRQVQTWTGATTPAVPSTTNCPDNAWPSRALVTDRLTNASRTPAIPMLAYNATALADISNVRATLYVDVNPGERPAESRLASGISLRNHNRRPTAAFTATPTGNRHVLLNGSAARDPENDSLQYTWYVGGTQVGTGVTLDYRAPSATSYSFTLRVRDGAGLENLSATQVVQVT